MNNIIIRRVFFFYILNSSISVHPDFLFARCEIVFLLLIYVSMNAESTLYLLELVYGGHCTFFVSTYFESY